MKLSIFLGVVAIMSVSETARAANPVVLMDTSMGPIKIELYEDKAPVTVKNFLNYVEKKHYDGKIFHRVMSDFMIQGGGFGKDLKESTADEPIKNEATNGLKNERGTIAMARLPKPDTATAQFYINVVNNPGLDKANAKDGFGYCVFGRVIDGMDVVDKIKNVKTAAKGQFPHLPVEDVVINSVKRVETK